MNAPPATATRDAAFLAHVLADALKLGLPDPDYITMHPALAGSTVGFQFNDRNGQDPLPRLRAWAGRFGADVSIDARPGSAWHELKFTHAGVSFKAYAKVDLACAGCGDKAGSHWEISEPDGPRKGCGILGCACAAYDPSVASDEAAAVLAASIDAGTPLVTDDECGIDGHVCDSCAS